MKKIFNKNSVHDVPLKKNTAPPGSRPTSPASGQWNCCNADKELMKPFAARQSG
jgi:hypothetical protein